MKPDGIHARNIELGKLYATSDRTIREWRKDGKPVENAVEMANMILVDGRSTDKMKAAAEHILTSAMETQDKTEEPSNDLIDPDWKEVMEGSGEEMEAGTVDRLRRLRTFFMSKLEKATKLNNVAMIRLYTEQVIALENAIGKNQLIAKKLGIDAGDILKREVVEGFLHAFSYVLMRGVDDDLDVLCKAIAGKENPEDIRPILEERQLDVRFLRPFKTVVNQRSGLGLPDWFVEALISAANSQVEDSGLVKS